MNISFTGHRSYNKQKHHALLKSRLRKFIKDGATRFFSGMALGFDLAAAEAILELRTEEDICVQLIAIIPFEGQAERYKYTDKQRYHKVLSEADEVILLSKNYDPMVYFKRNNHLVEQADMILAYYDGSKTGGTAYTIKQAKRKKIKYDNIFPQQQLSFF